MDASVTPSSPSVASPDQHHARNAALGWAILALAAVIGLAFPASGNGCVPA